MSTAAVELTDPLILPTEMDYHVAISEQNTAGDLVKAAAALGAAFYGYRWYMQRRLREELRGTQPTSAGLRATIERIYASYDQIWLRTILPHLVTGYAEGLIDVSSGSIPEEVLLTIAEGYAARLGEHLNEVSAEAVVSGYQAQLNRKVPPQRALGNVVDAFGVPPRAMNSLVNVWTLEAPKATGDVVPIDHRSTRAERVITQAVRARAQVLGETETWSTRSQAKQVVWLYGVETGALSPDSTRRWVTARDELVCPTCGPMDKTSVKVDQQFSVPGYGKVWAPPLHPNCRCDIRLEIDFTAGMAAQVRERVGKSRSDDPDYVKRDASGRFSSYESLKQPNAQAAAQHAPQAQQAQSAPQARQQAQNRFADLAQVSWEGASPAELEQAIGVFEQLLVGEVELNDEELTWLADQFAQIEQAVQATREQDSQQPVSQTAQSRIRDTRAARARVKDTRQARAQVKDTRTQQVRLRDVRESKVAIRDVRSDQAKISDTRTAQIKDTRAAKVTDTRTRAKPRGENPGLFLFERPAYTMITPDRAYKSKDRLGREMYLTSEADPWTSRTDLSWTGPQGRPSVADMVERHWRKFNREGLNEHWHQFISYTADVDQQGNQLAYLPDWDSQGADAIVSRPQFDEAWKWVLAGGPREANREFDITVEGAYGRPYQDSVSLADLAEYFGLHELLEENQPYVLQTDYADSSEQDYSWADGADYGTIAGRWKFMEDLMTSAPGVRLPHKLIRVAPENFDEDSPHGGLIQNHI